MDSVAADREIIEIEDDSEDEIDLPRQQTDGAEIEILDRMPAIQPFPNQRLNVSNTRGIKPDLLKRADNARGNNDDEDDEDDDNVRYEENLWKRAQAFIRLVEERQDQPVPRLQPRQITPATQVAGIRQAQHEATRHVHRITAARHANHPHPALHTRIRNINHIALAHSPPPSSSTSTSTSDDESEDNLVDGWNGVGEASSMPLMALEQGIPPPALVEFDIVLQQTLEIFPDVCPDHVRSIYENQLASLDATGNLGELVIVQIADEGRYPKAPRKPSKKRKTSADDDGSSDDGIIAEYMDKGREHASEQDLLEAKRILRLDFPLVPVKYIDEQLKEYGNLFQTYHSIAGAVRSREDSQLPTFEPLKKRRVTMPRINDLPGRLKREYDAVKRKVSKEDSARTKKKREAEEDAALDKKAFDEGDTKECECCFSDAVMRKMVHCDGDEPHFFCYECLQRHVQAQLDLQKHEILCMAGCKAGFSRSAKLVCLSKDIFARLERVQQQSELRQADVPGLESCPFCDFAAILPPIEEDKEFRCEHPDCKVVSCRLCKSRSHIPKTCEQAKKEHGIDERHIVEEEMTKALIRTCTKCKIAILKTEGCNKIVCSRCGAFICDVCGKDISRESYGHFGPGKCSQYDTGGATNRESKRVQEAEKAAKAKVRAENPNISEEDLEIKFSEAVKQREKRFAPGYDAAARIALMEGMLLNDADRARENQLRQLRAQLQTINQRVEGVRNNIPPAVQAHHNRFGQVPGNNGPDLRYPNANSAGVNIRQAAPVGPPGMSTRHEFEQRLRAPRTELAQGPETAPIRERARIDRRDGQNNIAARPREGQLQTDPMSVFTLAQQQFGLPALAQPGGYPTVGQNPFGDTVGVGPTMGAMTPYVLPQLAPVAQPQRDNGHGRRHHHHHRHHNGTPW